MNTGMKQPWSNEIENNFEKELYMAINLFRSVPSKWISLIKDCKRIFEEFKKDIELVEKICLVLGKMTPLKIIKCDKEANEACRKNNRALIEKNESKVQVGGNLVILQETKEVEAQEFTLTNWS